MQETSRDKNGLSVYFAKEQIPNYLTGWFKPDREFLLMCIDDLQQDVNISCLAADGKGTPAHLHLERGKIPLFAVTGGISIGAKAAWWESRPFGAAALAAQVGARQAQEKGGEHSPRRKKTRQPPW